MAYRLHEITAIVVRFHPSIDEWRVIGALNGSPVKYFDLVCRSFVSEHGAMVQRIMVTGILIRLVVSVLRLITEQAIIESHMGVI